MVPRARAAAMARQASTVSWVATAPDPSFADGYEVRVSTTTPDVPGFMANAPIFTIASELTTYQPHTVDLAAAGYANQQIYIAFRNNSDDKFILMVDDVVVD